MLMKILIVIAFCFLSFHVDAKEYHITSAAELAALQLMPGDKVIMKVGEWKDQKIVFKGSGTEKSPIVLMADANGPVKLTGQSSLKIDGSWLVVDGIHFTNGYSDKEDVIVFSPQSAHCRLTNSAVVAFNHPDKKVDYKWISVWGHYNRVDHCWLEGKTHQGTTLVIWLDDHPNYDLIDHNYFGARPDLGVNGGETIRIGVSTWSLHDSYTTVEKNIFEHCNGELEIISNKSCRNTIRNNFFYECAGTLTLRHGNDADVYGNCFIGNNQKGTGGIRVIAENHKVHDNYMQDLTGTGMSAAISIMDGLPNPPLTGHWQVKNASIYNNTIIHCSQPLCIGAGKNKERYLKAENTSFTNNTIMPVDHVINREDDSVVLHFEVNVVGKTTGEVLPAGFTVKDVQLLKDENGLYYKKGNKPFEIFWKKEAVGPAWKKLNDFKINSELNAKGAK
jgi:poly(beta-D-mannuronate) lyase